MNLKLTLLITVLLLFGAYSTVVVIQNGYFSFIDAALINAWTMQITMDLVIACVLICSWMLKDGRDRGVNALPYVIATVFLGSIAPLVYLIMREWQMRTLKQAR